MLLWDEWLPAHQSWSTLAVMRLFWHVNSETASTRTRLTLVDVQRHSAGLHQGPKTLEKYYFGSWMNPNKCSLNVWNNAKYRIIEHESRWKEAQDKAQLVQIITSSQIHHAWKMSTLGVNLNPVLFPSVSVFVCVSISMSTVTSLIVLMTRILSVTIYLCLFAGSYRECCVLSQMRTKKGSKRGFSLAAACKRAFMWSK